MLISRPSQEREAFSVMYDVSFANDDLRKLCKANDHSGQLQLNKNRSLSTVNDVIPKFPPTATITSWRLGQPRLTSYLEHPPCHQHNLCFSMT